MFTIMQPFAIHPHALPKVSEPGVRLLQWELLLWCTVVFYYHRLMSWPSLITPITRPSSFTSSPWATTSILLFIKYYQGTAQLDRNTEPEPWTALSGVPAFRDGPEYSLFWAWISPKLYLQRFDFERNIKHFCLYIKVVCCVKWCWLKLWQFPLLGKFASFAAAYKSVGTPCQNKTWNTFFFNILSNTSVIFSYCTVLVWNKMKAGKQRVKGMGTPGDLSCQITLTEVSNLH